MSKAKANFDPRGPSLGRRARKKPVRVHTREMAGQNIPSIPLKIQSFREIGFGRYFFWGDASLLLKARRQSLTGTGISDGASEVREKGAECSSAEAGADASPRRLGGKASTCPLSPDPERRVERYRKRRLAGPSASFFCRADAGAHRYRFVECCLFPRQAKFTQRSAAKPLSQPAAQFLAPQAPDRKGSVDSTNIAATCRSTAPDASRCLP
jgi:hypothetical protein